MTDLLTVGVVTGNDDRNRKSAHTEYPAGPGVDIHTVQVMAGNYTAGVEMKPERYAKLFEKTYREKIDADVSVQRVY